MRENVIPQNELDEACTFAMLFARKTFERFEQRCAQRSEIGGIGYGIFF